MDISHEAIRNFILTQFGVKGISLDSSTPLFSSGILDSFNLIGLISFIEHEAHIRVSPAEVSLDNFDSVDRLAQFVQRHSAG